MNLCSCLFLGEPPHQRESFRGEGPLPDHRSSWLRTYRTGHRIRIDDRTNQVGQKMWRSEVVKTWRSGNRTRENNQSLDYSCVALFRIVVSIIGYTSLWIPMLFSFFSFKGENLLESVKLFTDITGYVVSDYLGLEVEYGKRMTRNFVSSRKKFWTKVNTVQTQAEKVLQKFWIMTLNFV